MNSWIILSRLGLGLLQRWDSTVVFGLYHYCSTSYDVTVATKVIAETSEHRDVD